MRKSGAIDAVVIVTARRCSIEQNASAPLRHLDSRPIAPRRNPQHRIGAVAIASVIFLILEPSASYTGSIRLSPTGID